MNKSVKEHGRRGVPEAGFSMVEVTVVILLVGIIMAFVLPKVNDAVKAYNLRSTADHLAERLSAVRALALAKNQNVTFSFNNSSRQYGFDFTGTSGDGVPDMADPSNPSMSYFLETLPSEVSTTFPNNAPIKVTFNSRGEMPIGASEQVITLRSYNRSVLVRINLRGRITVE
ncbi:MAG: prepilin-type N-terminal cleavage/methylation domain-containing protein [Acidobacteria bacterium]|nr:prepilin-type N-terminal cleavage/methylation domain-containing protein [Acidobacteriota bacterium]